MSQAKIEGLPVPLELQEKQRKHRTLFQDAMRRFFRNRLAVAGFVVVIIFLSMALFANILAPYDYDDVDFAKVLLFPLEDPAHFLGTDELGREPRSGCCTTGCWSTPRASRGSAARPRAS